MIRRLCALMAAVFVLAAPAPTTAETGYSSLAGTTTISGSQPGSVVVNLPSPAQIHLDEEGRGPVMSVDGADDKIAGFLLEPIDGPTSDGPIVQRVIGLRMPVGYGATGGTENIGFMPKHGTDEPAQLPAGEYRLWLLTEPNSYAAVTIKLVGLDGDVSLAPERPSTFIVDHIHGDGPLGDTYYGRGTEREVPGGGYILMAASFRGDVGSALYLKSCIYFGGMTLGEPAHQSPVCLPRDLGGRDGFVGSPAGAFAPIAEGGSMALELLGTALDDKAYGVSFTAARVGRVRDLHTIGVWVGRE